MAKKKSEHLNKIWWFSGDRYFTVDKKRETIASLNKDEPWVVKDISDVKDSGAFSKAIFSKDLFSFSDRTIFLFDGKYIPDAEACHSMLEAMGDDKALIIITPSVDKRTKFADIFKEYLEEFKPLKDGRGFLDFKNLDSGLAKFKSKVKWTGSDNIFKSIVENSDYDLACAFEEIKKLRLYTLKQDKDITEEEHFEVGCFRRSKSADLLDAIKKRDGIEASNILYELLEDSPERAEWIELLHLLLETFNLFLFCKLADPRGNGQEYAVGAKVAEIWLKKGEKVHSGAIGFRYGLDRAYIAKRDIESISKSVAVINKAIMDMIYNSNIDHKSIMKSLVRQIV